MSDERKTVRVETFKVRSGECWTLSEFLRLVLDEMPEDERRASAQVEFELYDEPSLTVFYERPETDEELKSRIVDETRWARLRETHERRHYEGLKVKFEGPAWS